MSISVQDLKSHLGSAVSAKLDTMGFNWQQFIQALITALLGGLAHAKSPAQVEADLKAAILPAHVQALTAAGFNWQQFVAALLQLLAGLLNPPTPAPIP